MVDFDMINNLTSERSNVYRTHKFLCSYTTPAGVELFMLRYFSINIQSRRDCSAENKMKHRNLKI